MLERAQVEHAHRAVGADGGEDVDAGGKREVEDLLVVGDQLRLGLRARATRGGSGAATTPCSLIARRTFTRGAAGSGAPNGDGGGGGDETGNADGGDVSPLISCTVGVRVLTDATGVPSGVVGIDDQPHAIQLVVYPSRATASWTVDPNTEWAIMVHGSAVDVKMTRSVPFVKPYL